MQTIQLTLSDELARDLDALGLFNEGRMQAVLVDVARQEKGRRESGKQLLELMKEIHAANIEPMTMDEIVAEIDAARAEWHAQGL